MKVFKVTFYVYIWIILWDITISLEGDLQCCTLNTTLVDINPSVQKCKGHEMVVYSKNNSRDFNINKKCVAAIVENLASSDRYCLTNMHKKHSVATICLKNDTNTENKFEGFRKVFLAAVQVMTLTFFLITFIIYALLPGKMSIYRKSWMCMMAMTAIRFLAITLMYMEKLVHFCDKPLRLGIGVLLYYSSLASSIWFNLVAFNAWRIIWFTDFLIDDKTLFVVYCFFSNVYAVGIMIFATIAHNFGAWNMRAVFKVDTFEFDNSRAEWTFLFGPSIFLFMLNISYLISSLVRLLTSSQMHFGKKGLKFVKYRWSTFWKLMANEGLLTLLFHLSYVYRESTYHPYWFIVEVIYNSAGIWYFIILVPMREEVRLYLAKKISEIQCLQYWATKKVTASARYFTKKDDREHLISSTLLR